MLCKYRGNGICEVKTGELTELGGCFLGWQEGPQVVFNAILESYFGKLSTSVMPQPNGFAKGAGKGEDAAAANKLAALQQTGIPMGGLISTAGPTNQVDIHLSETEMI